MTVEDVDRMHRSLKKKCLEKLRTEMAKTVSWLSPESVTKAMNFFEVLFLTC